jgi:phage recombination protein Bet
MLQKEAPRVRIRNPYQNLSEKRITAMGSTAIQTAGAGQVSLVRKLAQIYGVEDSKFYNMIVSTVFPSKLGEKAFVPTEAMVMAFLIVCEQYDLNPILREIYPFIDSNGNLRVIVGIDGWIKHVQRMPQFDGHEFVDHLDSDNRVFATTCKIYRRDRTRPSEMTEYLSECKRDTQPWTKWPTRMLKHKAFIQASRYAFGMQGVEDEDEYERSITVETIPVEAPRRLSETKGTNALPPAAVDKKKDPELQAAEPSQPSTIATIDPGSELLEPAEVQQVWSIGMNRGFAKVEVKKLLQEKFGIDNVTALRKSQLEAALNHLIEAKKP